MKNPMCENSGNIAPWGTSLKGEFRSRVYDLDVRDSRVYRIDVSGSRVVDLDVFRILGGLCGQVGCFSINKIKIIVSVSYQYGVLAQKLARSG